MILFGQQGDDMKKWKILNTANDEICEFTDSELKHLLVYYDFDFTPKTLTKNKWEYILVDGTFYCHIDKYAGHTC